MTNDEMVQNALRKDFILIYVENGEVKMQGRTTLEGAKEFGNRLKSDPNVTSATIMSLLGSFEIKKES